ncbi:unnamed protein product [Ectocarpus sp. 12 AP-2014]
MLAHVRSRPGTSPTILLLLLVLFRTGSGFSLPARSCTGTLGRPARQLLRRSESEKYLGPSLPRLRNRTRWAEFGLMEDAAPAGAAAAGAASPPRVADGPGEDTPLFVYGTLMNEKVLFALLERVPSTRKASLSGYHRFRIKDHVFPAIRPREGGSVEGLLMTGLDAREKLIFDLFEDEDYHKVDVQVEVEACEDATQTATCYVWNASAEDQLHETWEPTTHFTEDGPVPDYVTMVERFSREIQEEGLLENTSTAVDVAV